MSYIVTWLLYNYRTSPHPLSYHLDTLCHISSHVVWSLPPIFFKWVRKWLSWALFLLFYWYGWDLIMPSCFSIFQLTCCHLLSLHHLVVPKTVLQFVRTTSALLQCHCLFNLAVRSSSYNIQTTFAGLSLC
jgi:hypothetical protein